MSPQLAVFHKHSSSYTQKKSWNWSFLYLETSQKQNKVELAAEVKFQIEQKKINKLYIS